MEAASVAALRGHQVVLFEKAEELGGQLTVAAVPPYKSEIADLTQYLATQVHKAGVRLELGKEATASGVQTIAPDAVILATGVTPSIPEIPGIERENVVIAEDVLAGRARVGERVIVIGGELVGCETAEFLADAGKTVTITRRGPSMAAAVAPMIGQPLVGRLSAKGVTMLTGVKYEEVNNEGLVITTGDGEKRTIPADTIVLAARSRPNTELLQQLGDSVPEIYQVGDCVEPRGIREAIADGLRVACAL
jgi:pyruvate/2-oxoglutarate dehydrogenase complex dihydrolipoamide dehydrogenase (E3) component